MTFEQAALALTWIAILLLALAMSGLMRQLHALQAHGLPHAQRIGLPAGTRVPEYLRELVTDGRRPTVLLFAEPDCETCKQILPEFQRFGESAEGQVKVFVLAREGTAETIAAPGLQLIERGEVFADLNVPLVPVATAISPDGFVIGTEPVGSSERLNAFLLTFERAAGLEVSTR